MSADDVSNTTVVTVSNKEVEIYAVSTDDWSDTHSEASQPIILMLVWLGLVGFFLGWGWGGGCLVID